MTTTETAGVSAGNGRKPVPATTLAPPPTVAVLSTLIRTIGTASMIWQRTTTCRKAPFGS